MRGKNTLNRLKEQEREVRKNLIIDAAERVFSVKPFDNVSMRDIADEAGMAVSSLYTYFPDQQSLFVGATLRDGEILVKKLESIIAANPGRINAGDIINTFIDYLNEHESYFRMMTHFMLHGSLAPDSTEKINAMMRRILDLFDHVFKNRTADANIRRLSHYLFAALNGILITFRRYPGRSDEEALRHMKHIGAVIGGMIQATDFKKLFP